MAKSTPKCLEKTFLYYIFDQRCLLGAILGHLGAILEPKMIKFCPFSIPHIVLKIALSRTDGPEVCGSISDWIRA